MLMYLIIFGALVSTTIAHEPFIVQFQWNYLNYTWPSEEAYLKADKDESYVEKNNIITGIKLWKDKMYLTIPRYRNGVPVTLAVTSSTPINGQTAPKLEPYPNWDMQRIGDCSAFQFVQSIEIDPKGRMWVLDTGRSTTMTFNMNTSCSPRLVILDIKNRGSVLRSYPFPIEVAHPESAFLNDIVIDHEDGGIAYIVDSDDKNPGIIVFSLQNNTSWKVSHESMKAKPDAIGFIIEQTRVTQSTPINGIALSPANTSGDRTLYYTPLSSFNIFAVPTKVLKSESLRDNIGQYIRVLGRKPSQTDGMMMSNTGILYFGLLADDAVSMWDSKNPSFVTGQRIISRDHHLMQWPTSFAFDERDQLWCITNRLHTFLDNSLNIEKPNFRAIMARVNMKSYQYFENGSSPELPTITAGVNSFSSHKELTIASLLTLLMVFIMH
ncbi:PREDICTED: protein yellow-like [Ceratosolen solmsi marchali]|uniref:Protein yellow-like n=1 Tax=Ceratosolen solmsi marchali TaxID=326594 RepID=A0AAJ6YS65_9HYME|nr:PREDICTED: protein yellow-like [Ceratosolen solmsi marchali]